MDDVYDFGKRLQEMRKQRGLSQKDVADKLEMHINTIAKYESNQLTPSLDVLKTLAILYQASTDYLLGLDKRNAVYIDDFSVIQQEFILNVFRDARFYFIDKTGG